MSYKLLFIIAAANNFKIKQIDIKTAFLYNNIDTEIYIKQFKGIGAIRELYKVYKLNKVLYSLKQSLYI
jgi:Reverse transcriptase (RNA-dependent DNA polymerase)